MIERPEATVLASQINKALAGKRICRATANQLPHEFAWYSGDPAGYNTALAGQTISHAVHTSDLSAWAFLATEQRIHPKRKMADLSKGEVTAMFRAVKSVLRQMVAQGGRDTECDLFGCAGGYRTILSKFTVETPCPACGSLIRKEAYLGGSIYYYPGCQRL
jgi:formamidopyrimidine-DNA glycosylase